MWARIGAYAGTTIGYLGWLIGFSAVLIAGGATDVLGDIFYPGFILTLGLALVTCLVMELLHSRFGPGGLFQMTLWGMLLFSGGIILFFLNHWLAPTLEGNEMFMEAMRQSGTKYRTGDGLPLLLLTAGAALLGLSFWNVLKDSLAKESAGGEDTKD